MNGQINSMSQYSEHFFALDTKNDSWSHLYQYINEGDNVLDVGCSTGALGAAFRELKHCKVVGIDIDPSDIKQAQKNLDRIKMSVYLIKLTCTFMTGVKWKVFFWMLVTASNE